MTTTRRLRTRTLGGLAVGVLLLSSACGGDEERFSPDEEKAIAALTKSMEGTKPLDHERAQWRCTAEGIVERAGLTGLKRSGLVTEDLENRLNQVQVDDREVASAIGTSFSECYDVEANVAYHREQHPGVPDKAWEKYAACREKARPLMAASVTEANTVNGGLKAQKRYDKAEKACTRPLLKHLK